MTAPRERAREGRVEWHRACDARDPRYDGEFFVAVTSTRVYCRPVCPSRRARPDRRRFFPTAAAAEIAGFRACLRCRPDLLPGRAPVDAVSRLARRAAARIADGGLDSTPLGKLAAAFGVSERHLRRVMDREFGATPHEIAEAHRLLRARQLLATTSMLVTRVAYEAGFQSLRRFNAVFRARYRMSPTELRRKGAGLTSAAVRGAGIGGGRAAKPTN